MTVSLLVIGVAFVMTHDALVWADVALAAVWGGCLALTVAQLLRKREEAREARVKVWTDQLTV